MLDHTVTQQDSSDAAALEKLLTKAKVPTLPIVAQKLVALCNDEMASFADFAQIIELDPGLAARILKVTNSAYYGLRNKTTTLERAIAVLGLKYVKTITLGFHLARSLNEFVGEGFDMAEFWRHSVLRAVISRRLAGHYCPVRQEEAFLIGLLQDCGAPLLAQALGEGYAQMWQKANSSQASLFQLEQEVFEFDHLGAATVLTERWSLAKLLAEPIQTHHHQPQSWPSNDETVQLCQIAYFVGTLSLNNPDSIIKKDIELTKFCYDVFTCDRSELIDLLEKSKEDFENISLLFAEILPERVDITELVLQAKDLLCDLANDQPRNSFSLEKEVQQLKSKCRALSESVDEYQQQSETDPLTGLVQRSVLERYLDNTCWKVQNKETSLTTMFLDIDNFKDINDLHSHAAGDRLLQALAQLLQNNFTENACVCRYGGDEFVVALTRLDLSRSVHTAHTMAQKIRQIEMPVRPKDAGHPNMKFSCSIGLLYCESGSRPGNSARVLELTDNQMYDVKKSGKNGVRFQVFTA